MPTAVNTHLTVFSYSKQYNIADFNPAKYWEYIGLQNNSQSKLLNSKFMLSGYLPVLFMSIISCCLVSCSTDMEKIKQITAKKEFAAETGKEVEVLYSDSARVKIKLIAPVILRYRAPEPHTVMPGGVRVYFYNDSLEVDSRLTANYAVSHDNKDEMVVQNNVIVINTKGEKLATEELIWDQKKEKIFSNKFVKITTPDEIIFGDGLESNQEFTEYKIKKIKGTINVKQDKNSKDS